MTREELKQRVLEAIDRRAEEIIASGERIRSHPELGFKEVRTARLALTGVRADLPGGRGAGPTFALLGELDALVVARSRTTAASSRPCATSAGPPTPEALHS